MPEMLSSQGFSIRKTDLSTDALRQLRQELTMTPAACTMVLNAPPVRFPIFQEDAAHIHVPKYYGLHLPGSTSNYSNPTSQSPAGLAPLDPGVDISVEFCGGLRPEQTRAIDKFMAAARDPREMGGILSLPCGQGKTVIALKIISLIGKKTLIIVHKDFLLEQWTQRIAQFLPGARVGLIKGKVIDVRDKDIVMGSVQSLSMKQYDDDVFAGISCAVVDECHRVGTEVFSRALMRKCFRYTLGLSATVMRKDGMSKVFMNFLGKVVHQGRRRTDAVQVVQYLYSDPDMAYCKEEVIRSIRKANMSKMINNITAFAPRTQLIVRLISRVLLHEPARKVLVLSDRKEQLSRIRVGLDAEGVTAGYYYGGLSREQLLDSETNKRVLLATFAYAAEGMDCRGLDTLFLVSPKSDIEQSCGRILREQAHERLRTPLIVDIVDSFSVFANQANKRKRYYKKCLYDMCSTEDMSVDPHDVIEDGREEGSEEEEEPAGGIVEYAFRDV